MNSQTVDKMYEMKLTGMIKALEEQQKQPKIKSLSFDERMALLVDREWLEHQNKRIDRKLKGARLKIREAVIEDIDYHQPRHLDRHLLKDLSDCQWIAEHLNILITGATGVGKSYIACALGNKACRQNLSTSYFRASRLFEALATAKGDGSYGRILLKIAKYNLLIIDDFAMAPLTEEQRHDMLEVLEDRYNEQSVIITSQIPINHWHEKIGEPTIADAIMDRLVHNAYKINLSGKVSMREKKKMPKLDSSRPPSP